MSKKAQIYFGLFAKREDVEHVMQEALPARSVVEFAYRIGTWKHAAPATGAFSDEGSPVQSPGQKYIEQAMVFYSLDKRIYAFNATRISEGSWERQVFPKIHAARQLERIPEYITQKVMTERWGVFFLDVYRRMLALEEMFDRSRIDGSEVDRRKLPKILHTIPGFGVEKPGRN